MRLPYVLPTGGAEVSVFALAIEDGEDLDRSAVSGDPVRRHRVELGGLPDFDEELAVGKQ